MREECDLQQQLAMVDASLAAALSTNEDQSAAHARLEEGYAPRPVKGFPKWKYILWMDEILHHHSISGFSSWFPLT